MRAAGRLLEHLPVAARRRRARRPGRRPAAGVGAGRRPARPRHPRAPRPVPGQVDLLDGLVLPGPRRRGPRPARRSSCSRRAGTTSSSPGLGIHCVDTNPWVTGAETCELAMALDALGDHRRALTLLARHAAPARARTGSYWTGWVTPTTRRADVHWPVEHTTYTAAAVILAVDALGEIHGHAPRAPASCAAPRWRRTSRELALECGCPSGDGVAGLSARTP